MAGRIVRGRVYRPDVPSDQFLKFMNRTHRVVIAVTAGRVGRSFGGMPVVELTTTGRRSGQARTCMLTSPFQEGDRIYLVASRGGDDHHPAWFLNLRDNPEVTASVKGAPAATMQASVVGPEERARIWPLITSKYKNYAGYQKKTDREIPLVVLAPRA
jgi:deazaflavin-dependent oxidoreductase (nitroreductase family)